MDLCLRTLIHSHRQRPSLLLRHVLPLQRRRATISATLRLLALLDVLPQPLDLLDRRRPRCNFILYPHHLRLHRSSILQPSPRLHVPIVRRLLPRPAKFRGLPHESQREQQLRVLPVLDRTGLPVDAEYQPEG